MRPVDWFEDFHGAELPRGWQVSPEQPAPGTISKPLGAGTGGIWTIGLYGGTSQQSPGVARNIRLRHGGAAPADLIDARNWSPAKDLTFECRFFVNMAENLDITIGLTGLNDPDQVLAALYREDAGWLLQARNLPDGLTALEAAGSHHTPGVWVELEIRTVWAERRAVLTIDGVDRCEVVGDMVTPQPMCAELQLWNAQKPDGVYSAPTLYVDAVGCRQGR